MAASPASIVPVVSPRRRPLALTSRRLEANRRNAARSTGPRTPEGKARVARNPIKHGFFVGQERWTPTQRRDFEETLDGLLDDLKPDGILEENCVTIIAESYVRMAAMLRYENIAALKHHQERDRELNERIAAADASEAARLQAQRDELRRAGLWIPTIPGPREATAIIRYTGSLDRTIRRAASELEGLRKMRIGGAASMPKLQKQTHFEASPRGGPGAAEGPRTPRSPSQKAQKRGEAMPNSVLRLGEGPQVPPSSSLKVQKQTHFAPSPRSGPEPCEGPRIASASKSESEKTNPLSSMFTGNRHQRRRAKALAARRRQ